MDTIIISPGTTYNLDNIHQNSSLSRQPTVPSSSSSTTSATSTTSNVPATPVPPTPSNHTVSHPSAQGNPSSGNTSYQHTCRAPLDKWVINLSNTPLSIDQLTLLQKGPNFAIIPKHPPNRSLHHSHRNNCNQTAHPRCRRIQI